MWTAIVEALLPILRILLPALVDQLAAGRSAVEADPVLDLKARLQARVRATWPAASLMAILAL